MRNDKLITVMSPDPPPSPRGPRATGALAESPYPALRAEGAASGSSLDSYPGPALELGPLPNSCSREKPKTQPDEQPFGGIAFIEHLLHARQGWKTLKMQ